MAERMIKKLLIFLTIILGFTGVAYGGPSIELDYMEYASDAAAQAAYVTSDEGAIGSDEIPDMTSNTAPSGTVTCNEGSALAWYTMDDNASYTSVTQWIRYQFTAGKTINRYTITSKVGTPVYGPVAWILQGSNDGSAWTNLDTRTGQSFSEDETKTYDFDNANSYTYYRLYITTNGGSGFSSIAEIELIICDLHTQSYSESTIKEQGSYSLEIFADQTNSLNDTLTRTISTSIDISNRDTVYFSARASRTGSNFKIAIHDSGGTTTEHAVNIASADTWQDETFDISGVAEADKDDIDSIIITITNADADNTIYLDNMRTEAPAVIEGVAEPSLTGPTDYEQKQEIWDNPEEDSIVGDVLGFEPVETLEEIPDSWPKWAISRFFRLDPDAQKATMDRQRQADIEKLKGTPYTTVKRSQSKQWEIENSWMSKADRNAMIWVKEPLTFDRKQGSRYLYVNIPKYSYYTKMFVYGEDAEIVQDFAGHGAITQFDETKLLRVDVFDGMNYIGTAYNAPIAKWVRKLTYADFGMAVGTTIDIVGVEEDLDDNYVIQFTSQAPAANKYLNLAYFKRDGDLVWHQTYSGTGVSYYTGKTGTVFIDKKHNVICTFAIKDGGVIPASDSDTKQFKIQGGSEIWTYSSGYITYEAAQLPDGGYVIVETKTEVDPNTRQMVRLDADGNKVNWGNGSAAIVDADGLHQYTHEVMVSDDGYIYTGSKGSGGAGTGGYQKWDGRAGAAQGNLLDTQNGIDRNIVDICEGREKVVASIEDVNNDNSQWVWGRDADFTGIFSTEIYDTGTDLLLSLFPCEDGGYVCSGDLNNGNSQLVKIGKNGGIDFQVEFEGMDFNNVIETNDGGFLAVGGAWVVKTNQYGETCSSGTPCE